MTDFRDTTLPLEERVSALLAALTPDEKMSLCAGRNFWETKPVPRLGLRPFKLSDGPRGVAFHSARRRGTSFPSGIALGASFDLDLSRRMGEALGREARAAGCGVILGPAVNLCRTPLNGRTFEYFSEDPHLNARLTVPYVQGVQSQKVAACVKHYVANNQETNRMRHDVVVSRRALRELYLPAFEAAVREGEAWSVMAAYNAINGIAACQHGELLNDVLREEWGFDGFVVSDWFAGRRTDGAAACLRGGLSLDMPGRGTRYRWGRLRKEFAAGAFDEADLDRALRGLLRIMFRTGHVDEPPRPRPWRISTPAHQAVARELAEAGMTLLRNEGGLLPLDPQRVRTLAVLGPRADTRHCLPLWGGSSGVWPP
ncbi:MAG: glycoside hydrolase family 3 protein, partial [Myxococcales bacterium]|nr:glycoside hydrolase family 3 protein [Myxococcales bacterium]